MCRRKRSRPSSKRRLTTNVKRLSSGRSVCASAIGVVDEQRLRTNGTAPAAGVAAFNAPASVRDEAKVVIAVIHFPGPRETTPVGRDCAIAQWLDCEVRARKRERGSPAVLGTVL